MFAKVVSYSFSHNGATYCFLTVHLSGHNKALLLLFFSVYTSSGIHKVRNLPGAVFLSEPDRSLRFSLMGIKTQHALHVSPPPFVAVKSSFYAC